MARWGLVVVMGLAVILVAIGVTLAGIAPWSPRPAPSVQEAVSTPAAVPKSTAVVPPAPAPAPPRQVVRATAGATTTVASITRVTTTRWDYECRLDTLEKPECEWFLKETRTETKVDKPKVSVPYTVAVAAVVPTATVSAAAPATPTAPTATTRPAATAPAPQAAPAEPKVEPPRPSAPPTAPPTKPPYWETGVGLTAAWTIQVPTGSVLIVGGYRVDSRGLGIYKAYPGGQTVRVNVTDGFATVVSTEAAPAEFCARVSQARQYGWAYSIIEPLPGWPAC